VTFLVKFVPVYAITLTAKEGFAGNFSLGAHHFLIESESEEPMDSHKLAGNFDALATIFFINHGK